MKKTIIEREQWRKARQKKKREERRKIIIRNIMLLWGIILVILFIRGIAQQMERALYKKSIETNSKQEEMPRANINLQEEIIKLRAELDDGYLILVNDEHPIRDYSEEDLVNIWDYLKGICKVKHTDMKLQEEAVIALKEMIIDFKEEVGENDLTIISTYRDFDTQEKLHYQSLQETHEEGEVFVARPDRSEHHTGLAVDFGLCYDDGTSADYDGTGIYKWINENCYKYGFIMRYDEEKKALTGISYEPWHFRYVGKVHAQIMRELNLCLEEYIEFIKGYTYEMSDMRGITASTHDYWIYYISAEGEITHIPLPKSKEWTVSGNNQDGFIVTVLENNKKHISETK